MPTRRQPSGEFFRRLKAYSVPKPDPDPIVIPPSKIRRYKESDAWLWTEVAAVVIGLAFVIPTAIALWIDLEDRKLQRIAQAWETVTRIAPGNSGKGAALEYLNSQGITLKGIDLSTVRNQSPSFFGRINLPGADLGFANLSKVRFRKAVLPETILEFANLSGADLRSANLLEADLTSADLSEANLSGANLSGANLRYANLSGTDLRDANLSGTELRSANLSSAYLTRAKFSEGANLRNANLSKARLIDVDLSGAYLTRADLLGTLINSTNLSGADLRNAKNCSQAQLDTACGDEETQLPGGLNIKACSEK